MPTLLTPGSKTSEHALAWGFFLLGCLVAGFGAALVVRGDSAQGMAILSLGLKLSAATTGSYALLRSALKVVDIYKRVKPVADLAEPALESVLPAGVKDEVHKVYEIATKALDALIASSPPAGPTAATPMAIAADAGASAAKDPAKSL